MKLSAHFFESCTGAHPQGDGWRQECLGWTIADDERGTVGIGRQPFATREDAQAWIDTEVSRRIAAYETLLKANAL